MSRTYATGYRTKLGQYEIIAPLGAGGIGEVYRARDPQLGRDVAIKILPTFLSRDPDRLRRFEQEARAAAALNHPNILSVYQMGSQDGTAYSTILKTAQACTLRQTTPLLVTRDIGTQEVYAISVKWPRLLSSGDSARPRVGVGGAALQRRVQMHAGARL